MTQRKLIIILIGALIFILVVIGIISTVTMSTPPNAETPQTEETNPPGMVRDPKDLSPNELDIIALSPPDLSQSVATDQILTITFSRAFSVGEIDFHIAPDVLINQEIKDNTLIITPDDQWAPAMQYDYSIVFKNDNQKARLYSFTTVGEGEIFKADTGSMALYEEIQRSTRINEPDIYLVNNVPYENSFFSVRAQFEPQEPAHYYFIITPKTDDQELVNQAVNGWLQELNFSLDQIPELDLRYE